MLTNRIFVGFDPREALAFHVCVSSLIRHSSRPLSIHPLALNTLQGYQDDKNDGSNQFNRSRFLVPYLAGFNGPALYMDGDMLVRCDISEVFDLAEQGKDVMVVKHDYQTRHARKFRGNTNENYPKKNWSSLMLFPNCANFPVQKLLPEFVGNASPSYLHRFEWTQSERIGELPKTFNWLVDEYPHNDDARILHFTIGCPCTVDVEDNAHAGNWWEEYHRVVEVNE